MPSSISKFRNAAHYGFKMEFARLGLREPIGVVTGKSRFLFGYNNFLSYLPFSTLADLNCFLRPEAILARRTDTLVQAERSLSIFAALSRAFSTPSVAGPAYRVCGYNIDRFLSDSTCIPVGSEKQKFPMVVVASRVAIGEILVQKLVSGCSYRTALKENVSVFSCKSGSFSCFSTRMSLRNREWSNHAPLFGYLLYNAIRSRYKPDLHSWFDAKELHSSSAATLITETAPDVIFCSSVPEDNMGNAADSSKGIVPSDTMLKLLSGSCCLPHPDKEETGGEDAHFICPDEQAIGVADGVGGWAELGVDAGKYARELMSNAVTAVREEPKGSIDPARVLEKAHSSTKVKGSSTACIIALADQGLHAINLGDSGFLVVRDGCTVFRSPVQQHDFNFTYQLESGDDGDLPSSGQVFSVPVAPGDVIIAGTDGLFDNLYNNEVTSVVVHALRAGLGPQVTAQKIAALARQRAQDRDRQTPFSTAAQDAGFRYYGGKLDDITVVVSYITSCNKEDNSLPPAHGS